MGSGGALADLAVRPGKAVVVSEESIEQWRLRKQKFGFGPHICWICRPFRGKPRLPEWLALLDHILDLRHDHGIELAVIDPLASFLPARSESEATGVMEALLPLQRLTAVGLAVLLLHHPRKHGGPDGAWARGSGALPTHADIILEMAYYGSTIDLDRRRKLTAYSRFDDTPRCRVIELDEAGTDFRSLGDFEDDAFRTGWQVVQQVLDAARKRMSRRDILKVWPADVAKPAENTLWRWLDRAVIEGSVRVSGAGQRADPFRYWTAAFEDKLARDPLLRLFSQDEEFRRRALGESDD